MFGMLAVWERTEVATDAEYPAVKITAAVSPIARPMEMIAPLLIPGDAAGNIMERILCHFVAPRANAPS